MATPQRDIVTNHTPADAPPANHPVRPFTGTAPAGQDTGSSMRPAEPTPMRRSSGTPTGNQLNYGEADRSVDYRKVADLIKGVRVAMLTTFDPSDPARPHIRPMYTQEVDPGAFTGELWFMSDTRSAKVHQINAEHRVALTYAAPDKNRYIVVHGMATCERNPDKAKELWNVHAKAWWPGGPEDPNLTLVCVRVESAEYWDGPSSTSYMISLIKSVATGKPIDLNTDHGIVGG
ncbi:MAG TPA: pyridoxamine 5'-phosphate oxidase family protein [Phycisphaerales bacterium]|nr:pyridoxamine 5'-phosphate oxidase family protein [Phycisphaerales bacterium]